MTEDTSKGTKISQEESPFAKHTAAGPPPVLEHLADAPEDHVAPLRTSSSGRSILKQHSSLGSEQLSGQDSEGRIKRAVSWHDFEGKHLHTVREFTPSEHDDDEVMFNPGEPKQCCVIC